MVKHWCHRYDGEDDIPRRKPKKVAPRIRKNQEAATDFHSLLILITSVEKKKEITIESWDAPSRKLHVFIILLFNWFVARESRFLVLSPVVSGTSFLLSYSFSPARPSRPLYVHPFLISDLWIFREPFFIIRVLPFVLDKRAHPTTSFISAVRSSYSSYFVRSARLILKWIKMCSRTLVGNHPTNPSR